MKEYALKVFRPSGTLRLAYAWPVHGELDRAAVIKVFARISRDHSTELWDGSKLIAWSGAQAPTLSHEDDRAVDANDGR